MSPDARQIKAILAGGVDEDAARAASRLVERAAAEGLFEIAYASFDSPLGTGQLAATSRGIVSIGLPGIDRDAFLVDLSTEVSPRMLELPARVDGARRELEEYFGGERREFDLALDWRRVRSRFSTRVLRETAKVPFGATATYGEVAARAGSPRAYRAAGTALGHNPIPIVVPCHRVLRAGGQLGEYGGGPEMKRFLLELEGAIE